MTDDRFSKKRARAAYYGDSVSDLVTAFRKPRVSQSKKKHGKKRK